jgi:hypothetical protein
MWEPFFLLEGERKKLFVVKRFTAIILRKFMTWSIVAILFFSLLLFAVTPHWSLRHQRGAEGQAFVDDEGLELSEESEFEGLDEAAENEGMQASVGTVESGVVQNSMEAVEDGEMYNSTESMQVGEFQAPVKVESMAFDRGKVKTVGVSIYSESSITDPLYSVNWGSLEPGAEKNLVCYIQNTGDFVSLLTLETDNWSPVEAAEYISLSWNYDGQTLNVDEVIQVTLTLTISENIEGINSFFFDINIIGSGI